MEEANEELLKYIDNLKKSLEALYKGKDITKVKNKSRTLKKIANRARAALWFSKSFGLDVVAITFKEVNTGVAHTSSMGTEGAEVPFKELLQTRLEDFLSAPRFGFRERKSKNKNIGGWCQNDSQQQFYFSILCLTRR